MYLVTGGAGFIGSHIVERLVAQGEKVRVLDNFSFGEQSNLKGLEDKIEIISGDILDGGVVQKSMEDVEVVFHQAGFNSVPYSIENPALVNRVNVEGTVNVLVAARDAGVRRVVYASSASVYGKNMPLPQSEYHLPNPISPFAVSKLAGEYYCKVFSELYGLETLSLRYFNVFGPRQNSGQHGAVIPRFIYLALKNEPFEVHGDGLQSRDFVYIDNVVDANLLAANSEEGVGEVFNIGYGKAYTMLDVGDMLENILGTEQKVLHITGNPGDVRHTLADISKAGRYLGYKPQVSFEEGLRNTIEYFAEKLKVASRHP